MATLARTFTLDIAPTSEVNSIEIYEALQRVPIKRDVHIYNQPNVYHVVLTSPTTDTRFAMALASELGHQVHIESHSRAHMTLRIGEKGAEGRYSAQEMELFSEHCNGIRAALGELQRHLLTPEPSAHWIEAVAEGSDTLRIHVDRLITQQAALVKQNTKR